MFLVTANKQKDLLLLSFIAHVTAAELAQGSADIAALLTELPPEFIMLTDFTPMEQMDLDCATEIGKHMEMCDAKGVRLIVRVIPDPSKDIGFNILTLFHYENRPRTVTCKSMSEAASHLGLQSVAA